MKGIWSLAVFVLFLVIVFGVMQLTIKEESISSAAGIKFNEVTKVVFYDGRGFNEPYTLSDKAKIYEFTAQLERYSVKKKKNREDIAGWIHRAVFYDGDTELMDIVFTDPLQINKEYYDMAIDSLSPDEIDAFIQSVYKGWTIR